MRNSDGLIPLVIGVTGHRNPLASSVDELKLRVSEILDRLDKSAPNTPFVFLSPLARGCDRIAAIAALDFKRRNHAMGIEVIGVLPLKIDDYRRDFADDPVDAAEFEWLLERVDSYFELPAWSGAQCDAKGYIPFGTDRDCHYRRLGLYVALQSQLMIAMWNGVRNGLVGGTAEVVDFCMGERPRDFECGIPFRRATLLLAPHDTTPIACIPTVRESGGVVVEEARGLAAASLCERFTHALGELELLNTRLAATMPSTWRSPMTELPVQDSARDPWHRLIERYRRLDALSAAMKTSHLRNAKLIPMLAAVGVMSFTWFSSYAGEYSGHAWISMALYFLFLAASTSVWMIAKKRQRTEWIFVHARALAEAMRIQLAWTGSGIQEAAPDLYLARRHGEVAFLRAQLRAATLECAIVNARGGCGVETKIGSEWIREQEEYFRIEGPAMKRRSHYMAQRKWWKKALVGSVLITSVALLLISFVDALGDGQLISAWANLGCFLVGLSLSAIVGFDYISKATLDEEDLEVSKRMHEVFALAHSRLKKEPELTHEIFRAMGKEALDEHADWFARHREKLQLPEAG